VSALCLLGAACSSSSGSDSTSAEGKAYVDAIMAQPDNNSGLTETERKCISVAVVDAIGVKALKAAGVTPDAVKSSTDSNSPIPNFTISNTVANAIVERMFKCTDIGALVLKSAGTGANPLPADKEKCLSKALGASAAVRQVFVAQFTGGDTTAAQTAVQDALLPIAVTCKISTTELAGALGGS
jgi:hypothetical protein